MDKKKLTRGNTGRTEKKIHILYSCHICFKVIENCLDKNQIINNTSVSILIDYGESDQSSFS